VAELICKLSALALAELYRLLKADRVRRGSLNDRLDQLGYDEDWLDEAIEAYDSK
jgi:hypothetical protein